MLRTKTWKDWFWDGMFALTYLGVFMIYFNQSWFMGAVALIPIGATLWEIR